MGQGTMISLRIMFCLHRLLSGKLFVLSTAIIEPDLSTASECPQESLSPEEVYRVVPHPSVYL